MKTFALATLAVAAQAYTELTSADYAFMNFIVEHGKSYGTVEEYNFRAGIFKQQLANIEAVQSTLTTSTVGVNFIADMTEAEKKSLTGFVANPDQEFHYELEAGVPNSTGVDWRAKGGVTPVKNQGQCGSCWSFSTSGALEGAHFVASGVLESLSEQQFVDCSWLNHGCNGGSMDLAFMYAARHEVETEAAYPYVSGTTKKAGSCAYDSSKGDVKATGHTDVTKNSSSALKAALEQQPVSVAIQADQDVFHYYTGGVITESCGTSLDHGVLAVGWGSENGQEYYIVKNSWSTSWGEQGFVRIGVEDGNGICGIQMMASYPSTN